MKKMNLFIIMLFSLVIIGCQKKADIPVELFTASVFENISDDPNIEYEKGYSEIKVKEADSMIKEDFEKVFLTDDGISLMYFNYGKKYELQTMKLTGKTEKSDLSKLIGKKKIDVEKIIQNKPFSNSENEIQYLSPDMLYFINFTFNEKNILAEILIGKSL